jgi:FkbM family methyltransferase
MWKSVVEMFKRFVKCCFSLVGLSVTWQNGRILTGENVFRDLRFLLSKDSVNVLDVGANEGQTIDLILQHFKIPTIHAFEPSTCSFEKLVKRGYGANVRLYRIAVGDTDGFIDLINYADSRLSSVLALDSSPENRFRLTQEIDRESVAIKKVDTHILEESIDNVDLLKIDTQGFDLSVLQGANDALCRGVIAFVMVEINFVDMYEGQASATGIHEFLVSRGFMVVDYYEKVRQGDVLAWCTALYKRVK